MRCCMYIHFMGREKRLKVLAEMVVDYLIGTDKQLPIGIYKRKQLSL